MGDKTAHPPAILLGADTPIGLTIIRDLGEHGVPVHAIARSRKGIGLYSRWTTSGYLRPPDDDATIELLNRIAAEQGARYLLAVSERDLLVIRAAADRGRQCRRWCRRRRNSRSWAIRPRPTPSPGRLACRCRRPGSRKTVRLPINHPKS
jgi:NAD(P)-dependent dehydrogenase (short-subunit alcohol dehydrogenase family)